MAGSIKGIIVEIGGDTSGLQKALSKVNSATSSLSRELKGINSLLKLDPKNTELLKQKQDVLNQSIKTTEDKLKQLKNIKEEADKKMADGTEINEENYRKLQREIISTQNKLSNLKNEASNWTKAGDSLIKFGGNLEKIGGKIDNLGNKLTTRLSVPIATTFAAGVKEAIEFESAFTGVTKTVDGTEEQLNNLKQGIKDLSKEIPSTTTEISAVAEAAGQLGIQTDSVLDFTRTMINMGNATNLSAEEAATTLARFANVTRMSQSDFDKLGSVIVALGNNFATTEAEIAAMGMNLASAGTQVGMSQSEIMALATALSSVGLEAQAGGTAFSKVMVNMQLAVEKGGKDLKNFASVAGMTTQEFQKAFKEDATGAIMKFVEGLSQSGERGKSAIKILDDMGITETRLRDALLRSANASEVMSEAVKLGNEAWKSNTALTDEASKRYATTESQLKIMKNKVKDVAVSLGDKLLPSVNKILDKVDKWVDKLDNLSDAQKENIVKIGLMVAAAGPLLKVLGTLTTTTGKVVSGIGTFTKAIGLAKNGIGDATGSAATLAKVFQGLSSPIGLAAVGITAAVGIIIAAIAKAEAETKAKFETMGNAAADFYSGIQSAEGYLNSFNETLFTTSGEQEELQKQMEEIQQGITQICKTASDERRDYTQEEINQLDEYFAKLRELKNREIEIQQAIAGAITQQAKTNAETFQGSLDEYKAQSQQWIATAQQQAEKTKKLIEDNSIEEVALLNQKYGTEANMQNKAYATEYNNLMEQKQKKIEAANQEVADVAKAYAEGYANRANQDGDFYEHVKHYNSEYETETERHNNKIQDILNGNFSWVLGKTKETEMENSEYTANVNKNWNQMYKNMSDSEAKQLGVWLGMLAQTELYGGKISKEDKELADNIIGSFDKMPKKTREAMKNAMSPMLEEMEKSEPTLFAKANGIAGGILSRLKKSFDIHSPSRETRAIFQNVMKGAELGLEDEEKNLNKQVDNIANQMKTNFSNMIPNMGAIKQSVIDKTRTVFTTPNITFNVQKMDEANLNTAFNYVNRRLGSQY